MENKIVHKLEMEIKKIKNGVMKDVVKKNKYHKKFISFNYINY